MLIDLAALLASVAVQHASLAQKRYQTAPSAISRLPSVCGWHLDTLSWSPASFGKHRAGSATSTACVRAIYTAARFGKELKKLPALRPLKAMDEPTNELALIDIIRIEKVRNHTHRAHAMERQAVCMGPISPPSGRLVPQCAAARGARLPTRPPDVPLPRSGRHGRAGPLWRLRRGAAQTRGPRAAAVHGANIGPLGPVGAPMCGCSRRSTPY